MMNPISIRSLILVSLLFLKLRICSASASVKPFILISTLTSHSLILHVLLRLQGYIGGITSFSESQFKQINGFPNNFWGWGGEDDELYKRTKEVGMRSTSTY
jgi:hypothetical protein